MRRFLPRRIAPATVVAAAALFFAIGGSAFAIGEKLTPQARCQTGAVKGIAIVVGDPLHGIANLPTDYSADSKLFFTRFNCNGQGIEVKRAGNGVDVRFVGNPGKAAIANVVGDQEGGASVAPQPDGSWRVTTGGEGVSSSFVVRQDLQFLIVLLQSNRGAPPPGSLGGALRRTTGTSSSLRHAGARSKASRSPGESGRGRRRSASQATVTDSTSAASRPSGARSSMRIVTLDVPRRTRRQLPTTCVSARRSSPR